MTAHNLNPKRKILQGEGSSKRAKFLEPITYTRLIRPVTLNTPEGERTVQALFDTGSNVFVLDQGWATANAIFQVQRHQQLNVTGFAGQTETSAGKAFTPHLQLQIKGHTTSISCELDTLEPGIQIIILGGWFLVQHPLTFEKGSIQLREHKCYSPPNIIYDEELVHDPEAQIIRAISSSEPHTEESLRQHISAEYHPFIHLFTDEKGASLPPHRSFDHAIELVDGKQAPFGPIYSLSQHELGVLHEYLDKMIAQGKIKPSKSPAGAPILFVPKPNGKLRLCVDYRGLNNVTVKNRYAPPLMNELRDRVAGAKVFTKLDLRDGYYLVRIKQGDEWKTAFRTRYGHFEYTVMPFGLSNAPATFQAMMNEVLKEFFDQGVVVYIDDVLIYTKTLEEHQALMTKVLKKLEEYGLAIAPHKSIFHAQKVEFLGYILTPEGISMSPEKVKDVLAWVLPKCVKDVQIFMGFANFYRRFILNFSGVCKPITDTLKLKGRNFAWGSPQEKAFIDLKQAFTSGHILKHFDPSQPVQIETDASNFALGGGLSQKHEGRMHPVAFHSRKLSPAECNYDIHDIEMLAIIEALKSWRHYCLGANHTIEILTNHQNLRYFTSTKNLNQRQARWAEVLSQFDFIINYRPGTSGGKPDALSRRPEYAEGEGEVHTALLIHGDFQVSAT